MNNLIVGYDAKRDVWIVHDGSEINWMTDGAMMEKLDSYREKVHSQNGSSPGNILDRFKRAWDRRMDDIVVVRGRIYDKRFDEVPEQR